MDFKLLLAVFKVKDLHQMSSMKRFQSSGWAQVLSRYNESLLCKEVLTVKRHTSRGITLPKECLCNTPGPHAHLQVIEMFTCCTSQFLSDYKG